MEYGSSVKARWEAELKEAKDNLTLKEGELAKLFGKCSSVYLVWNHLQSYQGSCREVGEGASGDDGQ